MASSTAEYGLLADLSIKQIGLVLMCRSCVHYMMHQATAPESKSDATNNSLSLTYGKQPEEAKMNPGHARKAEAHGSI